MRARIRFDRVNTTFDRINGDRIGIALPTAVAAFAASSPGIAFAQSSPFLTGATALQSNILILRCSASERGGTSSFASQLIGQREIVRTTQSRSRQALRILPTITRSEHVNIEPAVLDSEIEQLPDLKGYLKLASSPQWQRVVLTPPGAALAGDATSSLRINAKKMWAAFRGYGARSNRENSTDHAQDGASSAQEQGRAPDSFEP